MASGSAGPPKPLRRSVPCAGVRNGVARASAASSAPPLMPRMVSVMARVGNDEDTGPHDRRDHPGPVGAVVPHVHQAVRHRRKE